MYAFLFLPFAHFSEGQAPFCVAGDGGGDLIARLFVFFFKAILLFKTAEICTVIEICIIFVSDVDVYQSIWQIQVMIYRLW